MRFADWLAASNITDPQIAERLGVARETVRRWREGQREPDFETQKRIFELTGGQVTPNDWVGVGPRDELSQQVAS